MEINDEDKPFMVVETNLDPASNCVTHCVHLKLKAEPDAATLRHLLARARTRIPGVIELHFGKNDMTLYKGKTEKADGNTHALVSRHVNARALHLFQKHPENVALSRFLYSLIEREPTVVDFVNIPSKL